MTDSQEIYYIIDKVTDVMREQRHRQDIDGLLLSGTSCVELAYKLTKISVENESKYRKFEASLADETDENGKRYSGAYCETKAKATDEYKEWQKARQVIDILTDLANMSKVLARNIGDNFKAS